MSSAGTAVKMGMSEVNAPSPEFSNRTMMVMEAVLADLAVDETVAQEGVKAMVAGLVATAVVAVALADADVTVADATAVVALGAPAKDEDAAARSMRWFVLPKCEGKRNSISMASRTAGAIGALVGLPHMERKRMKRMQQI